MLRDRWFAVGVTMRPGAVGASVAAWVGAGLSSLCCLLPLAIITLGLGSGAFMAVTMKYRWILIPAGVLGVTAGFILVIASIALDRFPEFTADLLANVTDRDAGHSGHNMGGTR